MRTLAVEICLYHPELKFAGMLDLVCTMRKEPIGSKKASDERINVIVDFKTTTKAFHDSHAIQLGLYKMMWDATFPDVPIDAIANISPKEWWKTSKKQVSYQFEWQTDNEVLKQIPYLLELYKLLPTETKKVPLCEGIIDLNDDIDSNVTVLTLEELIDKSKEKMQEETPEGEEDNLFPNE